MVVVVVVVVVVIALFVSVAVVVVFLFFFVDRVLFFEGAYRACETVRTNQSRNTALSSFGKKREDGMSHVFVIPLSLRGTAAAAAAGFLFLTHP